LSGDDKRITEKRICTKLKDDLDPPLSYRTVEVLNEIPILAEDDVETLAVIPDVYIERHSDKEAMGVIHRQAS